MLANHKGEIPVFLLLLPFITGIALAYNYLSGINSIFLLALFGALSVIFIALNSAYGILKLYRHRWIGGLLMIFILLSAGALITSNYNELNNSEHFSRSPARSMMVQINNEPISKNGVLRFTAAVKQQIDSNKNIIASIGALMVSLKDDHTDALAYGDVMLIPAKYAAVDPPFNPAEFNYKRYLANQNIHYQTFLYPNQYKLLGTNRGNALISYSLSLRKRLIEKLRLNMRDTNAIAVASTLILGYKADLSKDVLQAYSNTGTVHVLSVSGAHVGIVYVFLALLLSFLNRSKRGKLIKAILISLAIWYYSMLTGFSPAVCRAALMISLVIIGKTYNRYINTLNILAISAFLLLLYDPLFITDVGFQLSYLAVFGLVILQPMVYKWLKVNNKYLDKLWALCSVSIAAQVITFPLSFFYFHQFPVYFLASNIFIVIPSAIIMYSGLLYLLIPNIPFLSKTLAWVLENTILVMNKVLALIEHLPLAAVNKIWVDVPAYLLMYAIIISLFYFMFDRKAWLIRFALTATLLLFINLGLHNIQLSNAHTTAYLSLNKHPAVVFNNGAKAVVFTDLSVTDKTYQYSVQPYLDSCGVTDTLLYAPDKNVNIAWLKKQGALVQFFNDRILVLNHWPSSYVIKQKININAIYLTGNPHISLPVLRQSFNYKQLIIDGTNSNSTIQKLKMAADAEKSNCYSLKRNKSLITTSNR